MYRYQLGISDGAVPRFEGFNIGMICSWMKITVVCMARFQAEEIELKSCQLTSVGMSALAEALGPINQALLLCDLDYSVLASGRAETTSPEA
jgi:hypothetical protein